MPGRTTSRIRSVMQAQSEVMSYPLLCEGILDVDRIVARQKTTVGGVAAVFFDNRDRKYLVAPMLWAGLLAALLILPANVVKSVSSRRLQKRFRKIGIRALDIIGASLGLILALPILIVAPILIKLDSPGPVFYRQVRTGINRRRRDRRLNNTESKQNRRRQDQRQQDLYGRPFYIYKFRTMTEDAERRSGAVWAMQDDPRITTVGRWLRRLHLDEIPQFWNVLYGDMSLVGPRPERPEIIRRLIVEIPDYNKRLAVKPGLTGPAQICLGYDSSLDDVRRKIQLDLFYISKRSLLFQLRVLALTLIKILSSAPTLDAKLVDPHLHLERMSFE